MYIYDYHRYIYVLSQVKYHIVDIYNYRKSGHIRHTYTLSHVIVNEVPIICNSLGEIQAEFFWIITTATTALTPRADKISTLSSSCYDFDFVVECISHQYGIAVDVTTGSY